MGREGCCSLGDSARARFQTRYFVITPDRFMDGVVRSALALCGVPMKDVFTEPIAPESGPLGLDATANDCLTLIRYAMPDDEHAAHAWWTNLPLAILRVRERPSSQRPPEPFPAFVPEVRTAAPEDVYRDDLDHLVQEICARWGKRATRATPTPARCVGSSSSCST